MQQIKKFFSNFILDNDKEMCYNIFNLEGGGLSSTLFNSKQIKFIITVIRLTVAVIRLEVSTLSPFFFFATSSTSISVSIMS